MIGFINNARFYKQIDGLGMGLPLGPTFANICMCAHEEQWLVDCPVRFKPLFYRRYVDDTFVLFSDLSHANLLLNNINSKYDRIHFTMECESANKRAFLDCKIHRSELTNKFKCAVYRKETFSGLGTSYYSLCCFNFKLNGIRTLFSRANKICSNYSFIHSEFEFLTNYFISNDFPRFFIESRIHRFWRNGFEPNVHDTSGNTFKTKYFSLPYFGSQSEKLKEELCVMIGKYF